MRLLKINNKSYYVVSEVEDKRTGFTSVAVQEDGSIHVHSKHNLPSQWVKDKPINKAIKTSGNQYTWARPKNRR